jgi:hypothetical protein
VSGQGGAAGSGGSAGAVASYAQAVTASKPSAWWRFEEVSGTTVKDESGTYPGTLTAAPYTVTLAEPGAIGTSKAVKFSHESAAVDFGDVFDFDGASLFTIEMFVNPSNFDDPSHNLLTKYDSGSSSGWATYVAPANAYPGLRATLFSTTPTKDVHGLLLSPTVWSYIAYTYDATNLCTYLGVSGGSSLDEKCSNYTAKFNIPNTVASMKLGTGFQGRVDELAIYVKRLPKSELQAHYAAALAEGL